MDWKRVLGLPCGRIFMATLAWTFVTGGLVALLRPGLDGLFWTAGAAFLCIPAMIFAVGLAAEAAPTFALAMLLVAPFLAGFYWAALMRLSSGAPGVGVVLLAVALAPAWIALGGGKRFAAPAA